MHIKFYVEERHMLRSRLYAPFVIGTENLLQIVAFTEKTQESANLGVFPDNYDKIRRLLIKRRYLATLKERGETHRHKFVLHTATENLGEVAHWRN